MKIGIVGYSSGDFDIDMADELVSLGLAYMSFRLGNENLKGCELVSGLTDVGIPGIAYKKATDLGLKTVGIACSLASEYDCFPVDSKIIVGDDWGDESKTFIDYIDAIIRVGGGKQSFEEVAAFKKLKPNAPIIEMELPRKG